MVVIANPVSGRCAFCKCKEKRLPECLMNRETRVVIYSFIFVIHKTRMHQFFGEVEVVREALW